jgi:hypothetical protein
VRARARALNGMQCSPGGRDRLPSRPFSRLATWLACDPACLLATAQVLTFMMFCKEGLENVPTQIYRCTGCPQHGHRLTPSAIFPSGGGVGSTT